MKQKQPSEEEQDRCIELRKQSKMGLMLSIDDHQFCEKMWRLYPEWYNAQTKMIFEETKPFGAS